MNLLPKRKRASTKRRRPNRVNCMFTIGTAFHDLIANFSRNPDVMVFVVDVPHEIGKLHVPRAMKNHVVLLPIGSHKTIQQLVEKHGTDLQREALKGIPAISSNDGLAQLACSGTAAIRELLSHSNIQQWLQDVVPELIRRAGGKVPQVRAAVYAGSAGGVASQGAATFLDALITIFVEAGVTSIDIAVHLIGGISYVGRGFQRSQQNAACSLVTWLDQFQAPTDASVTYSLYAFEARPVASDRETRSHLIADEQTAVQAFEVQNLIRQQRSNRSADGQLGNVLLLQTSHGRRICSQQIRNDVASQCLPDLESLTTTQPARGQVVELRFNYTDSRKLLVPAEELVEPVLRLDDPEAILDVVTPGPLFDDVELVAELLDETCPPLSKLDEVYSELPSTPQEFGARQSLLLALQERCSTELELTLDFEAELQLSVDVSAESLLKARSAVNGRTWRFWKSDEKRVNDLCDAIDEYRDCTAALCDVSEEIHQLESAIDDCQRLIEQDSARLDNLIHQLKSNVSYTKAVTRRPMVSVQPLDSIFSGLMATSLQAVPNQDSLAAHLDGCVEHVTRFGLQNIVGAVDDSVDAIVSAVRSGHSTIDGPEWGGTEPRHEAFSVVVYPPVAPGDQVLLKSLHRHADQGIEVAFADRDAPSRNLVHLNLAYCRELADLLTPYYQAGLRKAIADPARPLFLSDLSVLKNVGIEIDPDS